MIGRRRIVKVAAWALRRGMSAEEIMTMLIRSYPHRDGGWRLDVINEAQERNRELAR